MNKETQEAIREVAAKYWQDDVLDINDRVKNIIIKKMTHNNVCGFLPPHNKQHPAYFKIMFSKERFKNEVLGYQRAKSFSPIDGVNTPRLLSVIPENQAIITEKFVIRNPKVLYSRALFYMAKIKWHDVGRWLRCFHDTECYSAGPMEIIDGMFSRCQRHLCNLTQVIPCDATACIKTITRSAEKFFQNQPIDWVTSHGDFWIGNIKITPNSTLIFDFEGPKKLPRWFEVIKFFSEIEDVFYFPKRKRLQVLIYQQFLDGYGFGIEANPANAFFYLVAKLDKIARQHRWIIKADKKYKKKITIFIEKHMISTLCQWLANYKYNNSIFYY